MRTRFHWLAAGIAAFLVSAPVVAQDVYPSRTVRIVIPWPPSGPPDLVGRLMSPKMSEIWGRPVVVENRAGATGTIGSDLVAKSAPDGYTLLVTANQPLVIAPALFKVAYDAIRDFAPIAMVSQGVTVMIVNPGLRINSVADLIAAAKAKPGSLTYATSGVGSFAHLGGELIKLVAGIDMVHVPFQGAVPALNAVVSGQVDIGMPAMLAAVQMIKAGKVKALGLSGAETSDLLPGVLPLSEQGLKDVIVTTWVAAFAPAKTPRPIVQQVRDTLEKAYRDPGVQEKLQRAGIELHWEDADQLARTVESDLARWRKVITMAHIKPE